MAVIEFRDQESVIGAFENTGSVKFAIWQGTIPVMVYDEKDPDFEEGNTALASDKLSTWLNFIQEQGTTAIYMLKVYPDDAKNITNKTAFRAATRFQLTPSNNNKYENTPDGRVMVIRDNNRPAVNGTGGNNSQLQALIEQNKQMMDMFARSLQQQQETKIDKLIGFLEEKSRTPPEEGWDSKLMKLGEMIVDKPDIIDRIGYIFRPDIYTRSFEPEVTPISGTAKEPEPKPAAAAADTQNESPKNDNNMADETPEEQELTEPEVQALTDRQNAALDKVEDVIGLEELTEILEALAETDPQKLQKLTVQKLKSALAFL